MVGIQYAEHVLDIMSGVPDSPHSTKYQHVRVERETDPDRLCDKCGERGFFEKRKHGDRMRWKCVNCLRLEQQARYHKNPLEAQARNRAWREGAAFNQHELRQVNNANERAKLLGLSATLTVVEWRSIKAAFGGRCARFETCKSDEPVQIDHILSLSRGGPSESWNIQPLCSLCNHDKERA